MLKGKAGETYIIAGPTHTLVEALKTAQEITGVPIPSAMPARMFSVMSALMSVVEKFVNVPDAYTSEGLRVIAGVTYIGDASKAKRTWGYNSRSLKDGLTETLKHEMSLLGMKG